MTIERFGAELRRTCQRLLKEEAKRRAGGVKFIHVRGHSDDVGNDRADLLVQWGKEEIERGGTRNGGGSKGAESGMERGRLRKKKKR